MYTLLTLAKRHQRVNKKSLAKVWEICTERFTSMCHNMRHSNADEEQMIDTKDYVLGLDIGSASIGWALIQHVDGGPHGILSAGVRVFDPGVDGKMDRGQEESRNKVRREARLQRRQARRRAARRRDLFSLLQSHGLLPPTPGSQPVNKSVAIHETINQLDRELWAEWQKTMAADPAVLAKEHVLVYFLRRRCLDTAVDPRELGRVIFHLCQRRGFKSNRKAAPKKDEDEGTVKQGIAELQQAIAEGGARSLGEYFSRLNPNVRRIRGRWTDRRMFTAEFSAIWEKQAANRPDLLTAELRTRIETLLFDQRPIQDGEKMVGLCELEPSQKRAPWATLAAQRFRVLDRVNNMRLGDLSGFERPLSAEERAQILAKLETDGDQKFSALRKLIGAKEKGVAFNLERGGEKNCRGNRTASHMRAAFSDRWEGVSPTAQVEAVEDWRREEDRENAFRQAREKWGMDEDHARAWSESTAEPGYCAFSLRALARLLPLLEEGLSLTEAIQLAYPKQKEAPKDRLPPCGSVRNPAVQRAMSELRKVVNAIVRAYGKPDSVRIELARDLKKNRKQRQDIWVRNRKLEQRRQAAAIALRKETNDPHPSRADIEKIMLADECRWICPYTGKPISHKTLFEAPEFQVEHILPLGRFPDDSFNNKTLCHYEANARKHNQTPYEAFYDPGEERWTEIVTRVRSFNNPEKLRRFLLTPEETLADKLLGEFTARQLNDTRCTSKIAGDYLAQLYGGRVVNGRQRVFASSGSVTATLRKVWGLEAILGHGEGKGRDDHRHHSVDAVVVGLTSNSVIKAMSDAAARLKVPPDGRPYRPFKGLPGPWSDFIDSVRPHIENLNVSHRPSHKLSGPLHEETLYSKPYKYGLGNKDYVSIRKPLGKLSAKDIPAIVDPAVRAAVEKKLAELGGDLGQLNALSSLPAEDWERLPHLLARDGRKIPIRKVRVRKPMKPVSVGQGPRERYVQPGNNHHVEIFARLDGQGREVAWEGLPVSLLDAIQRRRQKQPVVCRRYGEDGQHQFKFSLMGGDIVEISGGDRPGLYRVRTIASNEQIALVRINDARIVKEMGDDFWRPRPNVLRQLGCRKVSVDPLGRVHPASD